MQRFGRTRREILVFLQKLEGYAKNHGFDDGRMQAAARPRFVAARKPLPCPDGRPETVEALERVHGPSRESPEINTARAANPISIDPRAIASAVTPIRSESAGKNSSTRS